MGPLRKRLRFNEVIWVGPRSDGISVLIRKGTRGRSLALHSPECAQRGHVSTRQDVGHQRAKSCDPPRWPPGLWETNVCCWRPPVWDFATATWADTKACPNALRATSSPVYITRHRFLYYEVKIRYQLFHPRRCSLFPLIIPPQSSTTLLEFFLLLSSSPLPIEDEILGKLVISQAHNLWVLLSYDFYK